MTADRSALSHAGSGFGENAEIWFIRSQLPLSGLTTELLRGTVNRSLDIIIGGVPRGGTTVAAKFMSLHRDIFCYAGETHLIPFMHGMFGQLPCRSDKLDLVMQFLRQQFMTAMVEMPRFSVSQGAHPGNLIFKEGDVDFLVNVIRDSLAAEMFGVTLYKQAMGVLRELLARADRRPILGEKTPSNVFAMADYMAHTDTKNVVVMREPFGVLRSMKQRVDNGDAYSTAFKGDLESNIGMYLEYAKASRKLIESGNGMLVRFEDMANSPTKALWMMYALFGREPEERVIQFVEGQRDPDIANRAPVNYRRLSVKGGFEALSPVDAWKIFSITRDVRQAFGYSDEVMSEYGFVPPNTWPDVEVPSALFALSGFYPSDTSDRPWMKRNGSLIAYIGKARRHDVVLRLRSEFPERLVGGVALSVAVNGRHQEVVDVEVGSRITELCLKVRSDEIVPMGNKSGYVIIDLGSSGAYAQISHQERGAEAQERSFQLWDARLRKSSFLFGRR